MKTEKQRRGPAINRRDFARLLGAAGAGAMASRATAWAGAYADRSPDQLFRYPEKTGLILMTDRPPQLVTPLRYFRQDFTPNEAFYARWRLEGIPASVDLEAFPLQIGGRLEKPRSLSVSDLRNQFEPVSVAAVNPCSGNSRVDARGTKCGEQVEQFGGAVAGRNGRRDQNPRREPDCRL